MKLLSVENCFNTPRYPELHFHGKYEVQTEYVCSIEDIIMRHMQGFI